jgi:LacI family transcriptional regulator
LQPGRLFLLAPPLATVRIQQKESGCEAARTLIEKITNPQARARHFVLATEIVVRGSTGSPAVVD